MERRLIRTACSNGIGQTTLVYYDKISITFGRLQQQHTCPAEPPISTWIDENPRQPQDHPQDEEISQIAHKKSNFHNRVGRWQTNS